MGENGKSLEEGLKQECQLMHSYGREWEEPGGRPEARVSTYALLLEGRGGGGGGGGGGRN